MADFVVQQPRAPVLDAPSEDAVQVAFLEKGDEVHGVETLIAEGLEWVRLPPQASVHRSGKIVKLSIKKEGFVPTEETGAGRLLKKMGDKVVVDELVEEGALSKVEIQEILDKCHNKSILLPLESKYWSRTQLELYVMSDGTIRPSWCSMPDENALANAQMTQAEVEQGLAQASAWISAADAILVGSGAGMGVDSGLSTFRGKNAGVWPGLKDVGLAYEEICHPRWFAQEPHLAWGFWNFCHIAYQNTTPHEGYTRVKQWADKTPLGAFSFTSNIDSHWAASGWGATRVVEVHGAVRWLQCSKPCCVDVWKAPDSHDLQEDEVTHRVRGRLPTCPKCGEVARPDVQMFGGDTAFSKARRAMQVNRYDQWLKGLESRPDKPLLRVVCLELGCGLTVPTVRKELEGVFRRFPGAKYVRVNPENPGLANDLKDRGVSLPLQAGHALQELEARMLEQEKDQQMVQLVFVDEWHKVGKEIVVPRSTTIGGALRLLEKSGVTVQYAPMTEDQHSNPYVLISHPVLADLEPKGLDEKPAKRFFVDVRAQHDDEPLMATSVRLRNICLMCESSDYAREGAEWCRRCMSTLVEQFGSESYQEEFRKQKIRKDANNVLRRVQFAVLSDCGLDGDSRGIHVMQARIGLFGPLDPSIWDLVGESMLKSGTREIERLPWSEAELLPPEPPSNDGTKYYVCGSMTDWKEMLEMVWDGEHFVLPAQLGPKGLLYFQIIVEKDWKKVLHPNVENAGEAPHRLRGPDDKNHGLNWMINKGISSATKWYEIIMHLKGTKPCKVDWREIDDAYYEEKRRKKEEREREEAEAKKREEDEKQREYEREKQEREEEKRKAKEAKEQEEREREIMVKLTYMPIEDENNPLFASFPSTLNYTVKDMKAWIGQHLHIPEKQMNRVKFLIKIGNNFGSMKEAEYIKPNMYILQMDHEQFMTLKAVMNAPASAEEKPSVPQTSASEPGSPAKKGEEPAAQAPSTPPEPQGNSRPSAEPKAPTPLRVTLTRLPLAEAGPKDTYALDLTTASTITDLRAIFQALYNLDEAGMRRIKFCRGTKDGRTMISLAREDRVRAELFVAGLESRTLAEPPGNLPPNMQAGSPADLGANGRWVLPPGSREIMLKAGDWKGPIQFPEGVSVAQFRLFLYEIDPDKVKKSPQHYRLLVHASNADRDHPFVPEESYKLNGSPFEIEVLPSWDKEAGISLMESLLKAYKMPEFQGRLRGLLPLRATDKKRFTVQRAALIHEAQKKVLPYHGFAADTHGVRDMMAAFDQLGQIPELGALGAQLDVALGGMDSVDGA